MTRRHRHARAVVGGAALSLLAIGIWRAERLAGTIGNLFGRGVPEYQRWDSWLATIALPLTLAALVWWWRRLGEPPATGPAVGVSEWDIVRRRFLKNRVATAGLVILAALYLVAVLAPLIAPYDPTEQLGIAQNRLTPPGAAHWLGTDEYARDVFSRIVYGARISLCIGFVAVALSLTIGCAYGAVAAYFGGALDAVMMRVVDMLVSFPRLVLLIAISALFETRSLTLIMVILGLTGWMGVARIVRGQVLSLKEQDFIQAARALGMNPARIIFRHLLPNAMAPVIVAATLAIGSTILVEAALSFLGLGVPPPTATWGAMVSEGRQHIDFDSAYWISTYPGLMIVFAVVSFNLMGDGLRDALDPRLRGT